MEGIQIVTLGELLIDMVPGETGLALNEVQSFSPKPGGAPANVAAAASRLGARSAFIGRVGQDLFGTHLVDQLDRQGVNIQGLQFDPEARTTLAFVALPDGDSPEFVFYRHPGADQRLVLDTVSRALISQGGIFHFGTLSLSDEPARSATLEAILLAKKSGGMISCDINYRPALWDDPNRAVEAAARVLPEVDLLKVNLVEACLLAGREFLAGPKEDELERLGQGLCSRGPELVLITLGRQGCYFQTKAGGGLVPAFQVQSLDTIGCGDAFIAGLLTRLSEDGARLNSISVDTIREMVRFGNAVGALTSTKVGAIPAMPYRAQVEAFLEDQKGQGDDSQGAEAL